MRFLETDFGTRLARLLVSSSDVNKQGCKMLSLRKLSNGLAAVLPVVMVSATPVTAAVVQFSDRATFTLATGANTVDDFGPNYAFPITSGVLDSSTVCCAAGTIAPGTIHSGVTYSTPVGNGNFFNIDQGGGFDGGFLDTVTGPRVLTVAFAAPQSAFGFDTNALMGGFTVTINTAAGQIFSQNFAAASDLAFFGFQNSSDGITSLTIAGDSSTFGFAIDNFTFNAGAVPEPASWALMLSGFAIVGAAARRRRQTVLAS